MERGYYFLVAVSDLSKSLEKEAEYLHNKGVEQQKLVDDIYRPIIEDLKQAFALALEEDWFPLENPYWINAIGKQHFGPVNSITCGSADNEIDRVMRTVSNRVADVTIDIFHCSLDFKLMEIHSYRHGSRMGPKITLGHVGEADGKFVLETTYIGSGNVTSYLSEDYTLPFEPKFKFQKK